jgi:hypothetical protein
MVIRASESDLSMIANRERKGLGKPEQDVVDNASCRNRQGVARGVFLADNQRGNSMPG